MDSIITCTSHMPNYTSISNTFIERYMLGANGSYVKVYLYLAKCIQQGDMGISITSLADQMENTEKDVLRALKYWQKKSLLRLTYADKETITAIEFLNPELVAREELDLYTEKTENKDTNADTAEFSWMVNIIEQYLNRLLTPSDVRTIESCYTILGASTDLVLHLYEYCISKGKTNPSYIEKVAIGWAEKGVHSVEEAKEASASYNSNYNAIIKAFALNRSLMPAEKKMVDKWTLQEHCPLPLVIEACNRTALRIHRADFDYTDRIIQSWQESGVRTLQDIEKADAEYAKKQTAKKEKASSVLSGASVHKSGGTNQFNNFPQRDYSSEEMHDLEKHLLHV